MQLQDDPFNPDNQFIRGEFYEAVRVPCARCCCSCCCLLMLVCVVQLARVAMFKFPGVEPHIALERLITDVRCFIL